MEDEMPFADLDFSFPKRNDEKTKLLENKTDEIFTLLKGMSYEDINFVLGDLKERIASKLFLS